MLEEEEGGGEESERYQGITWFALALWFVRKFSREKKREEKEKKHGK